MGAGVGADDDEHHEHGDADYGAAMKREPLCVVCTGATPSLRSLLLLQLLLCCVLLTA